MTAPSTLTWESWAPPLSPPTADGLPYDTASAIADQLWEASPHLCAALQWEAYAGMLPPMPSVRRVNTGAQLVDYDPPAPTGDYGLAMSRAQWHRSFLADTMTSLPLEVSTPTPWWGWGDPTWWVKS